MEPGVGTREPLRAAASGGLSARSEPPCSAGEGAGRARDCCGWRSFVSVFSETYVKEVVKHNG